MIDGVGEHNVWFELEGRKVHGTITLAANSAPRIFLYESECERSRGSRRWRQRSNAVDEFGGRASGCEGGKRDCRRRRIIGAHFAGCLPSRNAAAPTPVLRHTVGDS